MAAALASPLPPDARDRRPGEDPPARPAPAARPPRRLSPLDAAFLYLERPNQLLHVGCIAELEGRVDPARLVERIEERICSLPLYRQRPVRAVLDLDRPTWEDDPAFDVRRHVRHLAVPPPGDEAAMHALFDQLLSAPLDPNHPLWEIYLVDGLPGGRAAMLWKVHHCMIDGVSGAQVLALATDPAPGALASVEPAPLPSASGTASPHSPAPTAGSVAGAIRTALGSALHPSAAAARARDALEAMTTVGRLLFEPNSALPFNGPLTDRRRLVWASFPLDDVLAMRGTAGCKVNDVVLAIVAGALHRYLEERGVATRGIRVRALVPVSTRAEAERLSLGNLVTAMMPMLPVGATDPLERLRLVTAEMAALKERGQARASGLLVDLMGALPAPLEAALGRLVPERPLANTVCTNVPGPREERWLLGRRLLGIHPMVPLFQGMGLEFAVMSYAGRISIAATADAKLVPDPQSIAAALRSSFEELSAAVQASSRAEPEAAAHPAGVLVASVGPQAASPGRPRVALVGDLMTRDVSVVRASDSLLFAYRIMRRRRIRHLPVVDADHHVVGVITQRDLLAAQSSSLGLGGEEALVRVLARSEASDVMETHVSTARADEPAAEAGRRMLRHKIGCLPVVTRVGVLAGIVTAEDFLRWATEHMIVPDTAQPGQALG